MLDVPVGVILRGALHVAILTDLEWPVLVGAEDLPDRPVLVAILTDLEWPVLVAREADLPPDTKPLRSSPTWNGRCWIEATFRVAILSAALRSSPTWNGRCWRACRSAIISGMKLRSSPTWNGRCWRGFRLCYLSREVAILTDLEWPVLAPNVASPDNLTVKSCDPHRLGMAGAGFKPEFDIAALPPLRSSPTWNGRCWGARRSRSSARATCCDPHRLGMAGAGKKTCDR